MKLSQTRPTNQPHPSSGNNNSKPGTTTTPATSTTVAVRNPYVKTNSIQSTFHTLSAETDKFRKATQHAVAERQALLQRLQNGKKQTNDLVESIRIAQDSLGAIQRQVHLLEREEKSLSVKLTKDRQVLEDLTAEIAMGLATEEKQRREHNAELSALNSELESLFQQDETLCLMRLIHPETAAEILLGMDLGLVATTGDGDSENVATTTNDITYHKALTTALESLQGAAKEFDQVFAQKEAYENEIYNIRRRILANQPKAENVEDAAVRFSFFCACRNIFYSSDCQCFFVLFMSAGCLDGRTLG